jgi:hypothetical protein
VRGACRCPPRVPRFLLGLRASTPPESSAFLAWFPALFISNLMARNGDRTISEHTARPVAISVPAKFLSGCHLTTPPAALNVDPALPRTPPCTSSPVPVLLRKCAGCAGVLGPQSRSCTCDTPADPRSNRDSHARLPTPSQLTAPETITATTGVDSANPFCGVEGAFSMPSVLPPSTACNLSYSRVARLRP